MAYGIKYNMEFEIFNEKGARIFYTYQEQCIPSKSEIKSMLASNHRIKLDGKNLSKTKAIEIARKD